MDEWKFNGQQPRIGGDFVLVFAVSVHIDFAAAHLSDNWQKKAAPSEVFETEHQFSSLLMREESNSTVT